MWSSNEQTAGQTYNFSYLYNRAGALTNETYPSGRVVATGYDAANRVSAVTGTLAGQNTSYVSNLAYTPHGAPYSYMYGNDQRPNGKNLWPGSTYNSRLQPTQIYGWFNDDGDQFVYYFWYSWGSTNNNGNVQYLDEKAGNGIPWGSMTDFGQSFTYDGVNRLSSVSDSGGYSRSFGYDQYGNSWVSALSGIGYGPATPAWNIYSATTNQIPSSPYDAAGNMLALPPSYTFTYDAENRQTSEVNSGTPNATYSYDGNGARVQRAVTGSANASYVYDAFGQLAAEYAPAATLSKEYIRFGGQVVAIENATAGAPCQTCYLSYDHLGSVRLVTDQNANIIARHDYLPFGEEILGGEAGRSSQWGATDSVNQKFTGQERDAETGLDFFQARYYTGGVMRFLSPDPANAGADLTNPQSWNGYSYVWNNPLTNIDPTGMSCLGLDGGLLGDDGDGRGCIGAGVAPGAMGDPSTLNQGQINAQVNDTWNYIPLNNSGPFGFGQQPASVTGLQIFGQNGPTTQMQQPIQAQSLLPQTPGSLQKPSQQPKKPCTPLANNLQGTPGAGLDTLADAFSRVTHPLDMLAVNATFFLGGGGAIVAGAAAIVGGCLEPTPAEPLTCGAGILGGAPTMAGGGFLLKQGVSFFKNYTLPAIEDWGCHE